MATLHDYDQAITVLDTAMAAHIQARRAEATAAAALELRAAELTRDLGAPRATDYRVVLGCADDPQYIASRAAVEISEDATRAAWRLVTTGRNRLRFAQLALDMGLATEDEAPAAVSP